MPNGWTFDEFLDQTCDDEDKAFILKFFEEDALNGEYMPQALIARARVPVRPENRPDSEMTEDAGPSTIPAATPAATPAKGKQGA